MLASFLRRARFATSSSSSAPSTAAPIKKPFKFFERKDRYETYKAVDDLEFQHLDEAKMDKASLLGKKKLLEKEKLYEKKHPAHTTSMAKINKFVPVDRGALDFNRLVCLKTNTFADICKLVLSTDEKTFDAVNCSTALLQLAKAPEKQKYEEGSEAVLQKLARVILALPTTFPPRQTSNAVYGIALGKFTSLPQSVFDKLVVGRKDWPEWDPQHLATLAWSLTKLRQVSLSSEVLREIARQSRVFGMRRFNTHDLSQLEFAFAKTPVLQDVQAFHLCSAIVRNRGFPSFTTENLLVLFENYLALTRDGGVQDKAFLNCLCEEIGNRTFFNADEIQRLWTCFAACGDLLQLEPEFFQSTIQRLGGGAAVEGQKLPELSKLANLPALADAMIKLGIKDDRLVSAVIKALKKKSLPVPQALMPAPQSNAA